MEILQNRLTIAAQAEPYVGKYFSVYQVRNRLLGYTDGEIKEIDQQISYERNVGIIPDPNAQLLMRKGAQELQSDVNMAGMDPNQAAPGDMDMGGDPAIGAGGGGGMISAGGGMGGGASTMPS